MVPSLFNLSRSIVEYTPTLLINIIFARKGEFIIQDFSYMWESISGSDSATQLDGTTQFESTEGGQVFWENWLGPSLLWVTPKVDWQSQDYYNFEDLDRVEINTIFIASALSNFNGIPIALSTVTNRDMISFEYSSSMNRVEGNIQTLANNFFEPVGWENPKTNWISGNRFYWRDARRLEQNLLLLYTLLLKAIESLRYCGTFYAGEEGDIY